MPVLSGPTSGINKNGGATGLIQFMPAPKQTGTSTPLSDPKKIVTLPATGNDDRDDHRSGNRNDDWNRRRVIEPTVTTMAKFTKLPTRINSHPIRVVNKPRGRRHAAQIRWRLWRRQCRPAHRDHAIPRVVGGNGGFKR